MNTVTARAYDLIARAYPYEEYILHIERSDATNVEVITWQFRNGELVQLMLYGPDDAELLSISPAIILTEENESGQFFTAGEIELFLSRVKHHNS